MTEFNIKVWGSLTATHLFSTIQGLASKVPHEEVLVRVTLPVEPAGHGAVCVSTFGRHTTGAGVH